jgi:hypothetical protein
MNRPERETRIYKEWAKQVRSKYKMKCIACGKRGYIVHHLDGWDWCHHRRYDVKNGVTLCYKDHQNFHKLYKYGNNTRHQFDCFLRLYHNKSLASLEK